MVQKLNISRQENKWYQKWNISRVYLLSHTDCSCRKRQVQVSRSQHVDNDNKCIIANVGTSLLQFGRRGDQNWQIFGETNIHRMIWKSFHLLATINIAVYCFSSPMPVVKYWYSSIEYANLPTWCILEYQIHSQFVASVHARLNIIGPEEEKASRKAFLEYAWDL